MEGHEQIRGKNTWNKALKGIRWLADNKFNINIASRIVNNDEELLRNGFAKLFNDNNLIIDAYNKNDLVVFPEMNSRSDTPEITTDCWDILNNDPKNMMCSNSRMIVKRREDSKTHIVSCTLIPF